MDIIEYVMKTPYNTNPAILRQLVQDSGGTIVNLNNYYTKTETDKKINEAISNIDTSGGISIPLTIYEITSDSLSLEELIPTDTIFISGDLLIVTNSLEVKSVYQYNGKQWIACSGNVDASKVIMPIDITLAGSYTQVGNLTKTSTGTATFSTKGKSVAAALQEMLSKREQPKITSSPAVTLTFSKAGSYEVGTLITPTYSASLSAGAYTYGPATGITATGWTITDTNGNTSTAASGTFAAFTVTDGMSYTITAKASHGAGTVAVDNLGDASDPVIQISAGTKSKTSGTVTGYRSYFYGVLDASSETALTSDMIRGLTKGGAYNGSKTFTINANSTAKRIVVAIPHSSVTSTRSGIKQVILTSAMNTPITDSYVKVANAVQVEGANGATAVYYDVWVYEPAAIDASEIHQITLA